MGCRKQLQEIVMTIFGHKHVRPDWFVDFDGDEFGAFVASLSGEMKNLGFELVRRDCNDMTIHINSYADLLNCIRVSSDKSGGTHCIGHIIGKSEHLDICEDIATAVRRIAFAPETVAPAGEFRRVCHNCGCGC